MIICDLPIPCFPISIMFCSGGVSLSISMSSGTSIFMAIFSYQLSVIINFRE
ncbi:hypothetical protein THIOM_002127 [Candidatus Thiomargarita nelsonii]|uniref:Uncharacterized protein n=1 Tax=Candidatus Thiomargarita nelsonii TaxID=1003181 RepID=A0A176S2E5_9GAMM|nr:hypothetical protein THIOM_002127 [Candidatus Thiomargarita nelsonii]